ncbi:MAG: type I asparaginase [Bacteroidetes bacterium]|nr:type I asparaginase [Bacteroidota bacterium]
MKKILIIYTGGTIGMQHDTAGALKPFDFGKVSEQVPELNRLGCKLAHHAFEELIDSSNVTPDFWVKLAKTIEKNYAKYDGFVILHGTDTMAYSASALSFMLENLSKPVIFTGSQLPLGAIRTDAKRNLITSVEIAAGKVIIPEVCIYFNNQLFRGNRAEKFTSSMFDAFQSLNCPPLATVGVNVEFDFDLLSKPSTKKLIVHTTLEPHIGLVRLFPGITEAWMEHILSVPDLKALVMETYGSGNAPTDPKFIRALAAAIKNGLIVINVSQCSGGSVEQGKYETSKLLKEIGVISGADLTTEAALTKLMVLLGQYPNDSKKVKKMMIMPICGEMKLI